MIGTDREPYRFWIAEEEVATVRNIKLVMVVVALLTAAACSTCWADLSLPADTDIQLKFTNWDVGTLYFGTTFHTLYTGAALAALPQIAPPNVNPGEDGWGIFNLDNIKGVVANNTLWSSTASGGSGGQIAGIFWGLDDAKLYQETLTTQDIFGNGLQFAFYYAPSSSVFDYTPGPSARMTSTGGSGTVYIPGYPTVTNVGTPLWTGVAVPGFATDPITGLVDPTVSFESRYNTSNDTSDGGFLADLMPVTYVDGNGVTQTIVGSQNDAFVSKDWGSGFFADVKFHFTASQIGAGSWLLRSNDPGDATTVTPECSSMVLLLSAAGPLGLGWLRRRRRS